MLLLTTCVLPSDGKVWSASDGLTTTSMASYQTTTATEYDNKGGLLEPDVKDEMLQFDNTTANSTYLTRNLIYHHYKQLPAYLVYGFFFTYSIYITSIPGLITNSLTIYVSTKITPRTTSELNMFVLGATDLFVVSSRMIYQTMNVLHVRFSKLACQTIFFLINVFYTFSNWIVVCWTVERFIAVMFPMKLNAWCSVRMMKSFLICCLVMCFLILSPQFTQIYSATSKTGDRVFCMYSEFHTTVYSHIENTVYIYIPVVTVVFCNAAIVYKTTQIVKIRAEITSNREILDKHSRNERQMTRVLVTIAAAFVFFHFTQILAKFWQYLVPNPYIILLKSERNYVLFFLLTFWAIK